MPKISKVGQAMPSSPIRKLMPFAVSAQKEGKRIIHLNIGQPDIDSPEVAFKALNEDPRTIIEYSPSEGYESYRENLAAYYRRGGVDVNTEDVIITTGGSEALIFGLMSSMDPGDEVIIPEPFYANYNSFAHMAGLKVVPVTAVIEDGFSLPQMEDFEAVITSKTKAILICNPGNPTGKVYAPEAIDALAKLCQQHDLYLMADEVYREFCYGDEIAGSVMNLKGLEQNAIMIDSVSKRFSMCGARVGALVTKNVALRATVMKFAMARLSPPTLGQIASEAALLTPDLYFEEVRNRYVARRNFLVKGLNDIPHVLCPEPGGAFYAICRLPIDSGDAFCQWMLEEFDLDGDTVMMAPASGFYSTPGAGEDEVRLAYVLDIPVLEKAIACIRRALELYPGRTT
ncbi:MAG: pyridoxal phosphate-dependent aminotransferase [Flavobacteriales bacterium]|nr:pyridoxal phosphate-dependent aminotransferase [Flavobacteriales bacterium]